MVKVIHLADDGTETASIEVDDFTIEVIYSGLAEMLPRRRCDAPDCSARHGSDFPRGAPQRPRAGPQPHPRLTSSPPVAVSSRPWPRRRPSCTPHPQRVRARHLRLPSPRPSTHAVPAPEAEWVLVERARRYAEASCPPTWRTSSLLNGHAPRLTAASSRTWSNRRRTLLRHGTSPARSRRGRTGVHRGDQAAVPVQGRARPGAAGRPRGQGVRHRGCRLLVRADRRGVLRRLGSPT